MSGEARTIYVDLDDVLGETARHCLYLVEREFGKTVQFEDLTDFDLGTSCGLEPQEREHLYRVIHEPGELLAIAPISDAIATLYAWQEQGYEIAIVTGRPPECLEASRVWLDRAGVPYASITAVDKYGRFEAGFGDAVALEALAARRYVWAVEDSLPVARYLAEALGLSVVLPERPWNQTAGDHPRIHRHADWAAIRDVVSRLQR